MASSTENNYKGDIVKFEVNPLISRKVVTVVAAAALKAGTMLGIKIADGKYYPSVAGAADGTQNPCAILLVDTPITAGAQLLVLRRMGVVAKSALIFDASYDTQPEKDAAYLYLEDNAHIVASATV